jgi:thiamine biosynthesis lipoprotein
MPNPAAPDEGMPPSVPLTLLLGALLFCLSPCAGCGQGGQATGQRLLTTVQGRSMGTSYTVKVVRAGADLRKADEIRKGIEAELNAVDSSMSTYRDDSELSRFNASTSTDEFQVTPATAAVVRAALEVGRLSDGAYDVTVEPLVRLWNFGSDAADVDTVPSDKAIQECMQSIGQKHLTVSHQRPALKKDLPELRVDLSSIAKGYAVDRVAERLAREGFENYMVEVGGEVRTRGHNRHGQTWQIAIERPTDGPRQVYRVLPLEDCAMATSGGYRNYFEKEGRRYSHLIDPRSGQPITHRLASVTVLADRCVKADALATAMLIMGPEAGMKLAEKEGIAAAFLVLEERGLVQRCSSTFPATTNP